MFMRIVASATFAAAVFLTAASIATAQDTKKPARDASGTVIQHSGWKNLPLEDAKFNVPLLTGVPFDDARERTRDNRISQQEYRFGPGDGTIRFEHSIMSAFNTKTTDDMNNPETIIRIAKKVYGGNGRKYVSHEDPVRIEHKSLTSAGHYAYIKTDHPERPNCVFAVVGYQFKIELAGNTQRPLDTVALMNHCAETVSIEPLLDMLTSVKMISDRAAYRKALASR